MKWQTGKPPKANSYYWVKRQSPITGIWEKPWIMYVTASTIMGLMSDLMRWAGPIPEPEVKDAPSASGTGEPRGRDRNE